VGSTCHPVACSRATPFSSGGVQPPLFVVMCSPIPKCCSTNNASVCIPLASLSRSARNQQRGRCSVHVNQCGVKGVQLGRNRTRHVTHSSDWASYDFLNTNLPSTLCAFYPYEDFSQMQPRRVSMSVYQTATAPLGYLPRSRVARALPLQIVSHCHLLTSLPASLSLCASPASIPTGTITSTMLCIRTIAA